MKNELSVSLNLNTEAYENSIRSALDTFNKFQTSINKLDLNTSQISELSKVFKDVRNTAIKELDQIKQKWEKLSDNKIKLQADTNILEEQISKLEAELNRTHKVPVAEALRNQIESLREELQNKGIQLEINDEKLGELETRYETIIKDLQSNPLEFEFDDKSLIKYNTEIDNINKGLDRTGKELDEVNEETGKLDRTSSRLNLMGRIFSQIKNSIASAINPLNQFRKQWNTIIMDDTSRFGATFKNISNNITEYLTPVIEKIATLILKLIAYANEFLKALSGGKIDLFKLSAKSAKEMAKSAQKANQALAGFDEINDIGSKDQGSSIASPFTSDEIKGPDLNLEWVEKLKTAGEWIRTNWPIIIGVLAGAGVIALMLKFSNAGKSVGTGIDTMLTSFGKAAEAIAILGGIALVIQSLTGFMEAFTESGLTWDQALELLGGAILDIVAAFEIMVITVDKLGNVTPTAILAAITVFAGLALVLTSLALVISTVSKNADKMDIVVASLAAIFAEILLLGVGLVALGAAAEAFLPGIAIVVGGICAILVTMALTLPTILEAVGNFITKIGPTLIEIIKTISKCITVIIDQLGKSLPPIIKSVGSVFTSIFNGVSKVIDTVGNTIVKILREAGRLADTVLSSIIKFVEQLGPAINIFVDNAIKAVTKLVNFLVSAVEYAANLVVRGMNKIIRSINGVSKYVGITIPEVSEISIPRFVPRLDVGTGYVPQDMLAVIHQGEAVIPKQFNDQEYFGTGNEEVVVKLDQLIETLENKNMTVNISKQTIGQASVDYQRSENRRLGRRLV